MVKARDSNYPLSISLGFARVGSNPAVVDLFGGQAFPFWSALFADVECGLEGRYDISRINKLGFLESAGHCKAGPDETVAAEWLARWERVVICAGKICTYVPRNRGIAYDFLSCS